MNELGFKYQIGDVVGSVVDAAYSKLLVESYDQRRLFQIIGRQAHECYAGVQLYYEVREYRAYERLGAGGHFLMVELELCPAPTKTEEAKSTSDA